MEADLIALPALSNLQFNVVRRRAIFECFKWDPQVEDVEILAPFPLLIKKIAWQQISNLAAQLAAETVAAETELLNHPALIAELSLPRAINKLLKNIVKPSRSAARLMRFDFHLTTDGWQISEANTDVPGGLNEASGFTQLIAEQYPEFTPVGDPAGSLAAAISQSVCAPNNGSHATIALVHATAYCDDHQVMKYLAKRLEHYQVKTFLISPDQLLWRDNRAWLMDQHNDGAIDLIARFYPAEWLPNLSRSSSWQHFFHAAATPLCNPATSILTQSKRFPLSWPKLATPLPTWRALLPPTFDLSEVDWRNNAQWVLKPALGRVGANINIAGVSTAKETAAIHQAIKKAPELWVAQQRFEIVPLVINGEKFFPCIGVYTVDGRVAGAYGRIARQPLINYLAQDIAILMER